ncbi:Leukocyte surface antigen CD53 [Taenia crassiceps]|uniref:Leukocyte surface antigen CD53 n=1 Tax=Taenia crassiceps TaxID=6207 RepID=A0ABR4QMR8_9CEST
MASSLSTKVLRVLLVVFDILLLVAGGIMTGIGIYLVIAARTYGVAEQIQAIAIAFLVLGLLVLLTSIFGCCGALKMNKCYLLLFAFFVALMVIGEIACSVALLVGQDEFRPYIQEYLLSAIKEIETTGNPTLKKTITHLQDELDCCGANGPNDWKQPRVSCCENEKLYCLEIPSRGCVNAIYYELRESAIAVGAVVITLAVLEIDAMAISRSGSCIRVLLIVFNLFVFYAILMVLLIIGEITCGTLLFALKNQSLKLIEQYFSSSIYNIESGIGSSQLLNSIKKIQSSLECCGARGPGDWKDPYEFCCSSGRICFRVPQLGCIQAADQVLTEGRLPLGIAIIVLGVIEMGAVACAAFLARQIQQTSWNASAARHE